MEQLRPVSQLEKILFPIIVTIVVCYDFTYNSTIGWYAYVR